MNIHHFWQAVLKQNEQEIRDYFHPNAMIRWHNSNEQFTVDEFIIANCEYPGNWAGEVERVERLEGLLITVTHVYAVHEPLSFHVTSFIKHENDHITEIDEYWGDDGAPPQWRQEKHIGKPIK